MAAVFNIFVIVLCFAVYGINAEGAPRKERHLLKDKPAKFLGRIYLPDSSYICCTPDVDSTVVHALTLPMRERGPVKARSVVSRCLINVDHVGKNFLHLGGRRIDHTAISVEHEAVTR